MSERDEDIHLAMHREADELGKFSTHLQVSSPRPLPREAAAAFIDELLVQIARNCFDHGADLVGHVKAFLKNGRGTLSASLIDLNGSSNITNDLGKDVGLRDAELTVHVIVHGIWDPEVKEQSLLAVSKVSGQHGIEYKVIKDYYEIEKGIAHHK